MKYIDFFYFKLFYSIVYITHLVELNPDAGDGNSHPRAQLWLGLQLPANN